MLCVGENLIIANSYFCNYSNYRKLHWLEDQLTIGNTVIASFREKHAMLQRQLEMWNFFVKEKQKNVVQGEATFVDTKVDYLKMEDVIADAKREVLVLQVEEKTIYRQLEEMKNKNGTAFWPKPIIHPRLNNKFEMYILDNACRFCNRGYYCHDIAIAFYKHTFHPFCLEELLRVINKCSICARVFHLDWWHSWGF
jgi:hypothetical protein